MVDWAAISGAPDEGEFLGEADPVWDPGGHLGEPLSARFGKMMEGHYGGVKRFQQLYEARPPSIYELDTWTTGSGETIPVSEMTQKHAENTLNYLVRTNGEDVRNTKLGRALTERAQND